MKRIALLLLSYALWCIIAHGQNKLDSTVVLNEVVVKITAPKTKLRGDAKEVRGTGVAISLFCGTSPQ